MNTSDRELIEANKCMRAAIEAAVMELGQEGANVTGGPSRNVWMKLRICLDVVNREKCSGQVAG